MQAGFHRRIPLTMKVGRRGAVALGAELFAVLLVMQARDLGGGGGPAVVSRERRQAHRLLAVWFRGSARLRHSTLRDLPYEGFSTWPDLVLMPLAVQRGVGGGAFRLGAEVIAVHRRRWQRAGQRRR